MARDEQGEGVLRRGGARHLLEGGAEELTDDQKALLLALIEVNAGTLNEEERAALSKLGEDLEGYDAQELTRAVQHMVKAEPLEGRRLEWPELKRKRRSSGK